jgi:hypothetical protein
MPKSLRIDKKRVAYAVTTEDGLEWGVGIVTENQAGYRPVDGYGPYDEERAEGVAERLNLRIGVDKKTALKIVATSFLGRGAVRR